jgi:hypothetical protein
MRASELIIVSAAALLMGGTSFAIEQGGSTAGPNVCGRERASTDSDCIHPHEIPHGMAHSGHDKRSQNDRIERLRAQMERAARGELGIRERASRAKAAK